MNPVAATAADYAQGGFYWADVPPVYGYFEHRISSPGVVIGTRYKMRSAYQGSNTWTLATDGNVVGTSTDNPGDSRYLSTGLEATNRSSSMNRTKSVGLQKKVNGVWTDKWPGASVVCYSPATASWIATSLSMKDSMN